MSQENYEGNAFDIGEFLAHWGIKDMKWYHRRFQNYDGTLTQAGRERYGRSPKTIKKLSDSDLQKEISRYELESRYYRAKNDVKVASMLERVNTDLSYKRAMKELHPDKLARTKRVVGDILEDTSKGIVKGAVDLGYNTLNVGMNTGFRIFEKSVTSGMGGKKDKKDKKDDKGNKKSI